MKLNINGRELSVTVKRDGAGIRIKSSDNEKNYESINENPTIKNGNRIIAADYFIGENDTVIWINDKEYHIKELENRQSGKRKKRQVPFIESMLPGVVTKIAVKAGDKLKAGELIMVIESMKMANEIKAESDTVVKNVPVKEGAQVKVSDKLVLFQDD